MKAYAVPRNSSPNGSLWIGQALASIMLGFGLFLGLVALLPLGYAMLYRSTIFPGVSVAGVDLSGQTTTQAAVTLAERLQYSNTGQIYFQDAKTLYKATPRQLGYYLDVQASAQAAFQVGHTGSLPERMEMMFQAWFGGVSLPPAALYDERQAAAFLGEIAKKVDLPLVEASLSVNGADVIVRSGQVGRAVDLPATLANLRQPLQRMTDAVLPLVVNESAPVILDASAQAEVARKILSAPLVIDVDNRAQGDPGPWTFDQQALAAMLSVERIQSGQTVSYQVGLNSDTLRGFLQGLVDSFARTPDNGRYVFNDESRQLDVLQPAVEGRSLNVEASLKQINDSLFKGEHNVKLVVDTVLPAVGSEVTAEKLGIRELVGSYSSYFYGSSAERMQNIRTAAARFHGVLVPPGATFSMADTLGDVSLENGFAEALIIYGDRTIKGVGGGVCQVSTTLFRTVFMAGYPINERYPHAYRVGYYEQTAGGGHNVDLAGLDATVFVPVVDFKFTNDRNTWLLMETYFNEGARRLTWKLYSTSDGRSVDWQTSGIQNVVDAPPPEYDLNPDLAQGEIRQVDYSADGADVTITRTVTLNNSTLYNDTFQTHYLPWKAVYQYGPGTDVPTPEPTP